MIVSSNEGAGLPDPVAEPLKGRLEDHIERELRPL